MSLPPYIFRQLKLRAVNSNSVVALGSGRLPAAVMQNAPNQPSESDLQDQQLPLLPSGFPSCFHRFFG
jgi:hypothetical protein